MSRIHKSLVEVLKKQENICDAFSKIQYGIETSKDKLKIIELAEEFLLEKGFNKVRTTYYSDLVKIEVFREDVEKILNISQEIICKFRELGFNYITIDLEGVKGSSLNETILGVKLGKKVESYSCIM